MVGSLGRRSLFVGVTLAVCLSSFVRASGASQAEATPTATPTNAARVSVEARVAAVRFRPQGSDEQQLNNGDTRQAGKGDSVNVDAGGEAWLHFPQALLVRVFRDSQILKFEGKADVTLAPIDRFFLEVGTIFGAPDPNDIAKQKMTVDTQWATITDIGTRFLIHSDRQHQVTWVVVVDGAVQLTAGGVTVIVPAGWQSWVEPGRPPESAIPASRAVIGARFPTVDFLTNSAMHDGEVLVSPQCMVAASGLNTRDGPQRSAQIVDVLQRGERFEALRRTSGATWLYGITPRGRWGWVGTSFVRCGYPIDQLSAAAPPPLFTEWPIPPATPTPPPTSTPTPAPTSMPTATPKPHKSGPRPAALPAAKPTNPPPVTPP